MAESVHGVTGGIEAVGVLVYARKCAVKFILSNVRMQSGWKGIDVLGVYPLEKSRMETESSLE